MDFRGDKKICPQCNGFMDEIFTTGDTPQRSWKCPRCDYSASRNMATWTARDIQFAIFNELMQIRKLLDERLRTDPLASTSKTCPFFPPTCQSAEIDTARQTSCGKDTEHSPDQCPLCEIAGSRPQMSGRRRIARPLHLSRREKQDDRQS